MKRGSFSLNTGQSARNASSCRPSPRAAAPRAGCGSEQRTAVDRRQCSLRPGEQGIEVGVAAAVREGECSNELCGESVLRLASVARQRRGVGSSPLGGVPVAGVGGSPRVVDKRLREQAEPALLAQPRDCARQEARAPGEVARFLGGDAHVHRCDWIADFLELEAPHPAPHRWGRHFRIRQRDNRQESWVVARRAHAFGGVDDVLPRPGAGTRPPAAMRDRHERPQCGVGIAAGE